MKSSDDGGARVNGGGIRESEIVSVSSDGNDDEVIASDDYGGEASASVNGGIDGEEMANARSGDDGVKEMANANGGDDGVEEVVNGDYADGQESVSGMPHSLGEEKMRIACLRGRLSVASRHGLELSTDRAAERSHQLALVARSSWRGWYACACSTACHHPAIGTCA